MVCRADTSHTQRNDLCQASRAQESARKDAGRDPGHASHGQAGYEGGEGEQGAHDLVAQTDEQSLLSLLNARQLGLKLMAVSLPL